MGLPQQHELLAVEGMRQGTWDKVSKETIGQFSKHPERYIGYEKTLRMFDEKDVNLEEAGSSDRKELDDTVIEKLTYMFNHWKEYVDTVYQKEKTNQSASADLIIDGETIAPNLPATFLLGMETKLVEIRNIIDLAPTLGPGISWIKTDQAKFKDTWKAEFPIKANKTKKQVAYQVLAPATDKHAAQIEKWYEDVVNGVYTTFNTSGMLSVRRKMELLTKVDQLLAGVKRARMRANETEAATDKIAQKFVDFIMAD